MERFGIRAVLSLCAADEQIPLPDLQQRFAWARVVLPDHRSPNRLTRSQLNAALQALEDLQRTGPVYVHCMAARERSPLICMAWLMGKRGLSMQEALEYVSQLHPGTNPLPQHLALLAERV